MPRPESRHDVQHVLPTLAPHLVLPVAEEREVAGVHPLEQLARLLGLAGSPVVRSLGELGGDRAGALPHLRPVLDGGLDVAEHLRHVGSQCSTANGSRWQSISTWMNDSAAPSLDRGLEQAPFLVAAHMHDRPHDQVDGAPMARDRHRDRVDLERHVGGDGLDDRVRRLPAVLLDVRRVDVHLDLARPPDAGQLPVRQRGSVEVEIAPADQVGGRDVLVVRPDEPLETLRVGAVGALADARDHRVEQCRLRRVRARAQSTILASRLPRQV